jgi:hypothetical protein
MKVLRTLPILAHFLHLSHHLCNANAVKKTDEEHAAALIAWLKKEGGYFNSKLEMRRVDPSDPTSFFGMFANGSIPKEEMLLRIPTSMVLDSAEEDPDLASMTCPTVRNLNKQLKLKDESKYAPYVNYLLDTQPPGSIPSGWSENGKKLLTRVLGGEKSGDFPIPLPLSDDPFPWIDEWHDSCKGSNDPLEEYGALIVIQRSWDDVLIPVFDMMSHRNGHWLNTMHNDVHGDEDIEVKAKRDIEPNEQIYTSYNMCENCGGRVFTYGTPEILREYGFVEQMPQSWIFHDDGFEFGFRLGEKDNENSEPSGIYVVTDWIFGDPDNDDVEMLNEMIEQIKRTKETILNVRDKNVPDSEWQTITNYIDAMKLAFEVAVQAVGEGYEIPVISEDDDEDDDDEDYYEEDDHDEL